MILGTGAQRGLEKFALPELGEFQNPAVNSAFMAATSGLVAIDDNDKYKEVVCCESFIGDGGWPPEVGLQGQASNRHKLRG